MRSLRSEAGVTLVEGIVGIMIVTIGALAVLGAVDGGTRAAFRAEQGQVVINQVQAELERIQGMPFASVALTSAPATSPDPRAPASRVSGTSFAVNRDGSSRMPLVVDGDGTLSPVGTPFQSGDVRGTLQRFVVWMDEPRCPEALCPGAQDLKRVIVTATLDETGSGGQRAYQELHTDLSDPDTTPVDDAVPPGPGDEDTSATFWLTDTPCSEAERQPLTGNHLTHNTLGTCNDGVLSGLTGGAPDLMYVESPALDPNYPDAGQPLYDYSTDVEPATNGTLDKGLQLRRPTLSGCIFSPSLLDGVPQQKVHRWLAPPVPNNLELLLDGEATLSLWTRTINDAAHSGEICVWLFVRRLNALGVPVDTPVVNQQILNLTYFRHDDTSWPQGDYSEVTVDMDYVSAAQSLLPGEQLGLAISVNRAGTAGSGLEFMYDHPSFDSRLEVSTSSPLPIWE